MKLSAILALCFCTACVHRHPPVCMMVTDDDSFGHVRVTEMCVTYPYPTEESLSASGGVATSKK